MDSNISGNLLQSLVDAQTFNKHELHKVADRLACQIDLAVVELNDIAKALRGRGQEDRVSVRLLDLLEPLTRLAHLVPTMCHRSYVVEQLSSNIKSILTSENNPDPLDKSSISG